MVKENYRRTHHWFCSPVELIFFKGWGLVKERITWKTGEGGFYLGKNIVRKGWLYSLQLNSDGIIILCALGSSGMGLENVSKQG